ncbi:APC family permease [Anaerovorax odorimutans]|uniref:APC family permease n=1 Tax=Anaerovorax odorimutans TaxID=109327 RepID=A0ABT1RQ60_9FIRM|nr:APC family permease [Anaerovorax odorimutans]MCQ4637315.1 APC family permease [Anaerovorax odorimutans]
MSEVQKMRGAEVGDHGLKKHDIKVSTVVFMIFCLVAAGCYGIEEIIPACGPGLTIVILCILPFIWALPFSLVASELGSARPQEGGYYKWVQEALGEFWGFQAGWWRTVSIYIDMVSYVVLAGGYASSQWNFSRPEEFLLKAAIILVFVYINIRGVKDIGVVSTILSILVMVAFGLVAICGFLHWGEGTDVSFQMTATETHGISDWFFLIAGGISIGMWMYSGYESMSTIAGEVSNPQVIPKATLITVPLIAAVYIIPTVAGLGSLGQWQDWAPDGDGVGYGDVVATFWGPAFGVIFVIIAILAQCSIFNTYIASGSRGFFSLADDHLAPQILVKCDKKHGVPYVAISTVAVVCLLLCMLPFGFIIILDVTMLVASYILVYISAIVLRKRIPKEEYQFKIPGGSGVLSVICIVPICVALFSFFINGSDCYLAGAVGMVSGTILYYIWRRRYGGLTKKNPQLFPANKRTGLAVGDTRKIAFMLLLLSIFNVIACFFMPWYENGWEADSYFDGMLPDANVDTITTIIYTGLHVFTAVCAIATIIFYIISKKVEPAKK